MVPKTYFYLTKFNSSSEGSLVSYLAIASNEKMSSTQAESHLHPRPCSTSLLPSQLIV